MNTTSTPYDDVYRTMLNDCSNLILPVINEVFGEHYTGKETIVFGINEHFLNQQDGEEEKCITDTAFAVIGKRRKTYHIECQSTEDKTTGGDVSYPVKVFKVQHYTIDEIF